MTQPVAPNQVNEALDFVRSGKGMLAVITHLRCYQIDKRTLAKFEKAGEWILKADGDGYRLRTGKHSVYLFPGQLLMVN